MERPTKYVLLDRDGTVIVEKNYLSDPAAVELLPGAAEGLRQMRAQGYGLILVTNQSGIGRGFFTENDLKLVHKRLEQLLEAEGVKLDAIYVCPHAPAVDCECRKPKPKLAKQAAADFDFHLGEAWVIGDKQADVDLARNSGARSILVRTGYGRQTEASGAVPDYIADDLLDASRRLRRETQS